MINCIRNLKSVCEAALRNEERNTRHRERERMVSLNFENLYSEAEVQV